MNQAIGQENYRWFLAFLAAHVLLLFYGALALGLLLAGEIVRRDLMNVQFYSPNKKKVIKATWSVILQYLMFNNWATVGVFILCGAMCLVLGGFTAYHLWLTLRNVTTNESYKWSELKRAIQYYHKEQQRKREEEEGAEEAADEEHQQRSTDGTNEQEDDDGDDDDDEMWETLPPNQYNRGAWLNLLEVLTPFSTRVPPVNVTKKERKKHTGSKKRR
uniref:Palmitoyltransferase n=1 Tax=Octactis speculum TaxID=3111310 RepID=A0A7S2GI78_9STRA